jgi:hypothetical protein
MNEYAKLRYYGFEPTDRRTKGEAEWRKAGVTFTQTAALAWIVALEERHAVRMGKAAARPAG